VFSSSNSDNKLSIGGAGAGEGIKTGLPLSSILNPVVLSTILIGGEKENPVFRLEKEYYIPGGLVVSSWEKEPRECLYTDPSEVPVMLEKWDELCDAVEVKAESKSESRVSKKKRVPKKSNRKTK
jgi:hypothetical protein